ncbi:MAG TPA: PAS domain-containing protein [Dermatophilaceae bacterium]
MPALTTEFEGLLEAVPDALMGVDRTGTIRFVNRQAESLFGYPRDDLVGLPIETLVPESVRRLHKAHRESYDTAPRTRPMGADVNLTGVRRDGTEFPADISLSSSGVGDAMMVIAAVRDMTRYRRAEVDRARLDRLAEVVEFSAEAIVSHTLDGIITSWNPTAERMFGYSAQEIIGKSIKVLASEDQAEAQHAILATVGQGEAIEDIESVRLRKDGTAIPVHLTVSPIRDADGSVVGASAILHDTTEQRRALEAAERTAAIVEYSDDAIISSTLDGIVTSWNPAAERLYGYSSHERIGKAAEAVTPKDRRGEITAILAKVGTGLPVEHLETTRLRRDGTTFPVSLTVSPIRDADGAVIGASVICRDISQQRQALEYAQRMSAIVESSPDAIVSKSLDDTITSWNPAAERMFGWSSAEIIGKPDRLLAPADRANEMRDILATVGAGHAVKSFETLRVRKEGTVFPASVSISTMRDANGSVVGGATILRDLTEQKRTFESARSMIETSLDSFVAISPRGQITDANEATVRLIGITRDNLIGTSFSDYFTDPGRAEEIYHRVLEQGSVTNFPLTLRRGGRETLTEVVYNASVYRDVSGNVVGVFASARDVTELKQAAQYARSLIEASLDPLVTIDLEGKITDANEVTARTTGVPRDELIGTSFSDYFTDPKEAEETYQLVIEKGSVTNHPLTLRHKDKTGTLTEVLYSASLYRDVGGNVLGVFAATRDVTSLVQSQRNLAEQQARELERLAELERFQRLTVGRELKMIELKKQIEYLRKHGPANGGDRGEHD